MVNDRDAFKAWLSIPENIIDHLPNEIRIDSFLGDGGQGVVFRGAVNNEPAAIKVYLPGGQLFQRIEREVRALEMLNCPNIVRLLWHSNISVQGENLPVVVTSFVFGNTLDTLIGSQPFNHDRLAILTYDVTNSIRSMWDRRIVHRDLKPSNIILREDGRASVIDLGLARHVDQSTLTMVGFTWGTLGYMSPEQVRAVRQLTCKSDLYSLGILLLECAMGRHPTQRDQLRFMSMNFHESRNLPMEISRWEYGSLVSDLLHPRPTRRPQPTAILNLLSAYACD